VGVWRGEAKTENEKNSTIIKKNLLNLLTSLKTCSDQRKKRKGRFTPGGDRRPEGQNEGGYGLRRVGGSFNNQTKEKREKMGEVSFKKKQR